MAAGTGTGGGSSPGRPPTSLGARRPGFESVGGLEEHIRVLKELVLFPLMYKDVYARFHMKPPRGVLFYGPPGTGKTLVAGALAGECSQGERRVTFFSRKGADCYSKYVGESEQRLRAIFEEARIMQPSIIFFDEMDGLAPTRSSRHDIVHASVVSTLLALMDGLDSAHDVIVIGATNRIDAIDPALRRPGRFDKELFFPLPSHQARVDILRVHLRHWRRRPPDSLVQQLAASTVGYCGSDLQALCTEAVLCGLRRAYPDIYACNNKIKINLAALTIEERDFQAARSRLVAASHRVLCSPVQRLPTQVRPLLQGQVDRAAAQLARAHPRPFLFPPTEDRLGDIDSAGRCPSLLMTGEAPLGHTHYVAPALLYRLEHLPVTVIDIASLFEHSARATEEACIHRMRQARQHLPGVLYLPDVTSWWDLVDEATRAVFLALAGRLDGTTPLLLLATAHCPYRDLPAGLRQLWSEEQGEVFAMSPPSAEEREGYFRPLLLGKALAPPPRAPPAPSRGSSASSSASASRQRSSPDRGASMAVDDSSSSLSAELDWSQVDTFHGEVDFDPEEDEDAQRGLDEDAGEAADADADDGEDEDEDENDGEPLRERVSRLLGNNAGPYFLRSRLRREDAGRSRSRSRGRRRRSATRPRSRGLRDPTRGADRSRSRSRPRRSRSCGSNKDSSSKPPTATLACEPRRVPNSREHADDADDDNYAEDAEAARGAEVVVDRAALGAVLQRVVRVTAGRPARALEALHAALAGAVARYTLQADRRDLVQALNAVVDAYQQREGAQSGHPGSPAP